MVFKIIYIGLIQEIYEIGKGICEMLKVIAKQRNRIHICAAGIEKRATGMS